MFSPTPYAEVAGEVIVEVVLTLRTDSNSATEMRHVQRAKPKSFKKPVRHKNCLLMSSKK